MEDPLVHRRALDIVAESMRSFRAVVVQGARQVGKSTLAQMLASEIGAASMTLDREEDLSAARDDPRLFLEALGSPAVIDEVQRAGDPLVLALKQQMDSSRRAGQDVVTGSSNFLTTPQLSESLAGRIDLVTLWPLSMGEKLSGSDGFVDRATSGESALLAHRGDTPHRDDHP